MGLISMTNFLTLICIWVRVLYHQTVPSEAANATATATAGGGQIVQQICNKAAQYSVSTFDYDLCVTSLRGAVEHNMKSTSAADIEGRLGLISTTLAQAKARDTVNKVGKLLAKSPDLYDKTRLRDCKEMYAETLAALKEAERAIKSKSYMEGTEYLNTALDNVVTCEGSWQEEPGHVSPLSAENQYLQQLCGIGLAITTSFTPVR